MVAGYAPAPIVEPGPRGAMGACLSLYDAVNRSQHAGGGLRVMANRAPLCPCFKRLAE